MSMLYPNPCDDKVMGESSKFKNPELSNSKT